MGRLLDPMVGLGWVENGGDSWWGLAVLDTGVQRALDPERAGCSHPWGCSAPMSQGWMVLGTRHQETPRREGVRAVGQTGTTPRASLLPWLMATGVWQRFLCKKGKEPPECPREAKLGLRPHGHHLQGAYHGQGGERTGGCTDFWGKTSSPAASPPPLHDMLLIAAYSQGKPGTQKSVVLVKMEEIKSCKCSRRGVQGRRDGSWCRVML